MFCFVFYQDATPPTATCPSHQTIRIPDLTNQTELEFVARCTDNSGEIIAPNCSRQFRGEFLSLANSDETVICQCTDSSGNLNECNFTVTVIGM